jgi:hypothetical protein
MSIGAIKKMKGNEMDIGIRFHSAKNKTVGDKEVRISFWRPFFFTD